jgi:hypothetical protein
MTVPWEMLEVRFEGTFFTKEQIERLQAIAGLKSFEESVVHATAISGVLPMIKGFLKPAKARAEQDALRRITKIASIARELANSLDIEPMSEYLIRPQTKSRDDRLVSDIRAENEKARDDYIATTRQVAHLAVQLQEDRALHRMALGLLPKPSDHRNPEVAMLWPVLFRHWEYYFRRKVSKTEDGPLHSFINLVHEVVGLEPAAHRTFRDAVDRWKNERRSRRKT